MAAVSIATLNPAFHRPRVPSSPFSSHPDPSQFSSFASHSPFSTPPSRRRRFHLLLRPLLASAAASPPPPSSSRLYSSVQLDLTIKNVDLVLDDVRPYLIADGGDVKVVSVDDSVVSLKLQGACGTCPSSTTTMQMGIERVLKEKFEEAVKEIQQVLDEEPNETSAEAVNRHLDILRPFISNYGGSVKVLSAEGGECVVKYVGPEFIGSGIKVAIKEKFPDITDVNFTG
ncbi:hypothetical protein MLD38_031742 [Melastoma candidum]|uniref:Uncharacterized protein n=1 Tax=Melastoma candidum TaxID=119954 RepID=A0ACB9MSL6_9MYRT|nr:hypothetical protein MLD38_031742 [Melastoma candidum]